MEVTQVASTRNREIEPLGYSYFESYILIMATGFQLGRSCMLENGFWKSILQFTLDVYQNNTTQVILIP